MAPISPIGNGGCPLSSDDSLTLNPKKGSYAFDGSDPFALIKSFTPMRVLFGFGVLSAAILPNRIALGLAAVTLVPSALRLLGQLTGVISNPAKELVRPGRMTATMDGDFCVFILGARNNRPWKLDQTFQFIGDAYVDMIKELEAAPPEVGFIGAVPLVSSNVDRHSQTTTITYWRSYAHMVAWARAADKTHYPAWKKLSAIGRKSSDYGFWHEAYEVKGSQYESIYVNMPPTGLGAFTRLEPAVGRFTTTTGRMGQSDGQDWTDDVKVITDVAPPSSCPFATQPQQ